MFGDACNIDFELVQFRILNMQEPVLRDSQRGPYKTQKLDAKNYNTEKGPWQAFTSIGYVFRIYNLIL